MAEWLYIIPGITKQEGYMSFYDGVVVGISATLIFTVLYEIARVSEEPRREDIFRSGYKQALDDVTRDMWRKKGHGWHNSELKSAYESFIEPQYKSKGIDCLYEPPWK